MKASFESTASSAILATALLTLLVDALMARHTARIGPLVVDFKSGREGHAGKRKRLAVVAG